MKRDTDSLRKRYGYKLFANLVGYAIGLVTAGIIPRGLGPKAYGDFNYLTNFFSQVVGFLDMGSSLAFFTKISQRQKEPLLLTFYSWYAGMITILIICLVAVAMVFSLSSRIWPGQGNVFILLAVIWAVLNWGTGILNQITDAYGLTVSAELRKLYQKIFGGSFILTLYWTHRINLGSFFLYQYVIQAFLIIIFIVVIARSGSICNWTLRLSAERRKTYLQEFFSYCHPFFFYSLIGLLVGLFDRWILQVAGGSVQQGFYGFSYQIGSLCFLFTGAMTPLFMRDFSVAFGKSNMEQMRHLFRRYIPFLYSITAYFACFAAIEAEKIVYFLGGRSFHEAILAVTIMAFYPMHQTYGQLSGSMFYSTGQTRLYTRIGIIFMLIGIPVTYFLIAPRERFGLGSGATGLAVKMVAIQFIVVNIQLYYNARFLKLSFGRYLGHQFGIAGCLLVIGFFAKSLVEYLFGIHNVIAGFIITGIIYTLIVGILAYRIPMIFGLRRDDISIIFKKVMQRL